MDINFDEILNRISSETDIKNITELAKFVGTAQPHISRKKKKNEFSAEWAYKIASKYDLLTEWIITGKGPKRIGDKYNITLYQYDFLDDFNQWLSELIVNQPHRKDWAKSIILDSFPMFNEWLKRREIEENEDSGMANKKIA